MAIKAKSTTTAFIFPELRKRKPEYGQKWAATKHYFYDRENNTILGASPLRWGLVIAYYLVFLAVLLAIFSVIMAFFMWILIDSNDPTLQGYNNMAKFNPGMTYKPQMDLDSTLIRFVQGFPSSYQIHVNHLQAFMEQYENEKQTGENFIDCDNGKSIDQVDKVCRFQITELNPEDDAECTWRNEYGYDEGSPCVVLKLNKLYGWEPEPYAPDEVPPQIKNIYNEDYIAVTCEGETPVDKENIGNITIYPQRGFLKHFFPYMNQEGYRSPLVMVRFIAPANGVVINVWCKAWAKNLYHHRYDRAGSIHFELLVD